MFLNAGSGDFRTKNLSLGMFIFFFFSSGENKLKCCYPNPSSNDLENEEKREIRWERVFMKKSVHTSSFKHSNSDVCVTPEFHFTACVTSLLLERGMLVDEKHTFNQIHHLVTKNHTPPCAIPNHKKTLSLRTNCASSCFLITLFSPTTPLLFLLITTQLKRPWLSWKHCPPLDAARLQPVC